MPVEIAVLQIANSLLVPIWKLTNTCFIALPHAKSIFLPTQHKSVTYIILPGYSKSPEAGLHTCIYLAFRIRNGSEFSDILGEFPNMPKPLPHPSFSHLHSSICAVLLMLAFARRLPYIRHLEFFFQILFRSRGHRVNVGFRCTA